MDILSTTFMQRALVEAVLIGGICAVIGVYVILNGLSFIGAGISHATFGGIALGLFLGIDPVLAALVFCIGVALSIGVVSEQGAVSHDTAVGIFFAATMAFGVLLIGLMHGYVPDLFSYLFGNILAVTSGDIVWSAIMVAVVLAAITAFYKELLAVSFDAEMAAVMGLPVRMLRFMLLVLMSVTVVVSVKSVGVVLVSALLVAPAAAAAQLTKRFGALLALAACFGIASSVGGLFISVWLDIPSGASIVLTATLLFFSVWTATTLARRRRQLGTA